MALAVMPALTGCASKTLTIVVPEGGTPEQQSAQALKSTLSVLKQLENNPDDINIVFQKQPLQPSQY